MLIGAPTIFNAATKAVVALNVLTVTQIGAAPYVSSWLEETDKLSPLSPVLEAPGWNAAWSPTGQYLAIATNAPALFVYKLVGGILTLHQTLVLAARPSYISWSPNELYLAVSQQLNAGIAVYRNLAGVFSLYATLDSGTSFTHTCWNSISSILFAVISASPRLAFWSISGGSFLKQPTPSGLPTKQNVSSVSLSGDNSVLALGVTNSPTLVLYELSGLTLTRLSDPNLGAVDSGVGFAKFFGNTLAFVNGNVGILRIYSLSGAVLTLLDSLSGFGATSAANDDVVWGHHGDRIAIARDNSPYLFLFSWNGSKLSAKSLPGSVPDLRIRQLSYSAVRTVPLTV